MNSAFTLFPLLLAVQPPNRPFNRPRPRLTAETTGSRSNSSDELRWRVGRASPSQQFAGRIVEARFARLSIAMLLAVRGTVYPVGSLRSPSSSQHLLFEQRSTGLLIGVDVLLCEAGHFPAEQASDLVESWVLGNYGIGHPKRWPASSVFDISRCRAIAPRIPDRVPILR